MSDASELKQAKEFYCTLLEYYIGKAQKGKVRKGKAQKDGEDFWLTGQQIGTFLGYIRPSNAIAIIHARHADRLTQYSKRLSITQEDGVRQEVVAYSFKGVLEICKCSQKPSANNMLECLSGFFGNRERSKHR